jgi:hypothetical protein
MISKSDCQPPHCKRGAYRDGHPGRLKAIKGGRREKEKKRAGFI